MAISEKIKFSLKVLFSILVGTLWIILSLNFVKINLGYAVFENRDFTNIGAIIIEVGIAIVLGLTLYFYAQRSQKKMEEIVVKHEEHATHQENRIILTVRAYLPCTHTPKTN